MPKRLFRWFLIILSLGLSGLVLCCWLNREPLVQERPVSFWLRQLSSTNYTSSSLAMEILAESGSNAVPYLIKETKESGNSRKQRLQRMWCSVWAILPAGMQRVISAPVSPPAVDLGQLLHILAGLAPNHPEVVPALQDALCHNEPGVRFDACDALTKLGTNYTPLTIPCLTNLLGDANETTRSRAALFLGDRGALAQSALPLLQQQLSDPRAQARWTAARAIGLIGSKQSNLVPRLTTLLEDTDERVRFCAASAICKIEENQEKAFGILVEALGSTKTEIRRYAYSQLAELGDSVKDISPTLEQAMAKDPDLAVQVFAAKAHWRLHQRLGPVLQQLSKALTQGERWLRIQVTEFVPEMGPAAAPLVSHLVAALDNKDVWIRRNAIIALGSVGPAAAPALPKLQPLRNDPFPSVRAATHGALKRIAPPST